MTTTSIIFLTVSIISLIAIIVLIEVLFAKLKKGMLEDLEIDEQRFKLKKSILVDAQKICTSAKDGTYTVQQQNHVNQLMREFDSIKE